MPVRSKALLLQAPDDALGQITVLETTAGQYNAFFTDMRRDGHDGFHQRVVKSRGDFAYGNAAFHISQERGNQR